MYDSYTTQGLGVAIITCHSHTLHAFTATLSHMPSFHTLCSPYQDDFVVLHVRDEYDTVLETVLKTEFLTLLSEKYTTLTQSKLSFTFNRQ